MFIAHLRKDGDKTLCGKEGDKRFLTDNPGECECRTCIKAYYDYSHQTKPIKSKYE